MLQKFLYFMYKKTHVVFFCFSFRATLLFPLWMPWSMSTWVFLYIKYSKFWSVSLENFVEHKPLISEEWSYLVVRVQSYLTRHIYQINHSALCLFYLCRYLLWKVIKQGKSLGWRHHHIISLSAALHHYEWKWKFLFSSVTYIFWSR